MAQAVQIADPRLPYHPALEERFGCDRVMWRALTDAVFPSAKSADSVILALSYCRARKLDIMRRPVNIVPMWSSTLRRQVETVWPGIGEHRITAHRTGQYAGCDETEFGPDITHTFEGTDDDGKVLKVAMTFPQWAQHTLYKRSRTGERDRVVGQRVRFSETYATAGRKSKIPNERWQRAPYQMMAKVAEAAALRMAFPEELGNDPVAEEMEGREIDDVNALPLGGGPGIGTVIADPREPAPIREPDSEEGMPSQPGDDDSDDDPQNPNLPPLDDDANGHSDEHDDDEPADAPNDDITLTVADGMSNGAHVGTGEPAEPIKVEPVPESERGQLPHVVAHATEGGRGIDWRRYAVEFKIALAMTAPDRVDEMVLQPMHEEGLRRMKKQDPVGHTGLMTLVDRRRGGAALL